MADSFDERLFGALYRLRGAPGKSPRPVTDKFLRLPQGHLGTPSREVGKPRKARIRAELVEYRSQLTRFWFRAKLGNGVGDLEPRGFEVDEDVALRPNSGITIEGPRRHTDHVPIHCRHRRTTYRAECPLIPRRPSAHGCLVGLNERSPADPLEFRPLEFQFG